MTGAQMSYQLRKAFRQAVPPLLLTGAILILWEIACRLFAIPEYSLPSPLSVLRQLIAKQDLLAAAAVVTGEEVVAGFILSGVVGVALALVITRYAAFGRALYPIVVLFQTVPKIAMAPLLILWFGFSLFPKVLLIVVIAFFPVALNMLAGLQATDENLIALFRSVGATRSQILWRVQWPNSLPGLMAGLKVAITLSVIGAIVGEFAGASAGLGYVIQFASTQLETPLVFAALIEVSVVGVVFYYLVEFLEARFIFWVPRAGRALGGG
jgi:NitT/TauT family transport system permease protein